MNDMGSVVATITGYSGDERSNLIKLINSCGGYYVGKLSKNLTTHLVCWTFDGPKYEMAKRFGMHIINHQFFEDSLKMGRRLSESSYTMLSGKQVGTVLWKADKAAKKDAKKSIAGSNHKEQRKHGDMRDMNSHSMLEYVYITDEIDADDNRNTPILAGKNSTSVIPARQKSPDIWLSSSNPIKFPRLEVFEDCYPPPDLGSKSRVRKQKSLSEFESMRHRKKQTLVIKTDAVSAACAFDGVVSGDHPQSSTEAASKTEVLHEEPAFPNNPVCADAARSSACENLSESPTACTLVAADIACVICHTDHIISAEGVLTCGHCFCYQCIKKWASESSSKTPTCPLCKAPFDMITKRERKIGSDDKDISYEEHVVLLSCGEKCNSEQLEDSTPRLACIMCGIGDVEELLLTCSGCGTRSAHAFCLDPPLPPVPNTSWFCGRCSQRRRADTTWWHQLHLFERLED